MQIWAKFRHPLFYHRYHCYLLFLFMPFFVSCAPVKFSRSDTVTVSTTAVTAIVCNPKINGSLDKFTYLVGADLPNIVNNCSDADSGLNYSYNVTKSDGSVVTQNIDGLSGEAPAHVDFRALGVGNYYVYLTAAGAGKTSFVATTPLEFIVPGAAPLSDLNCDSVLNSSLHAFTMGPSDSNPTLAARCIPAASVYNWTVKKAGVPVTIADLLGASSTPNFRAAGASTYTIALNATAPGYNAYNTRPGQELTVLVQAMPLADPILCAPRLNGNYLSLTITSSSSNPLVSANCAPSQVQYNWSVTRNGVAVTVPDLGGPNSNPNFFALGVGTYNINLTATSSMPGKTPWSSTTPLVLIVASNQNLQTVNCSPRLNDTLTSINITTDGPNPKVTSGCLPATATLKWTAKKDGATVVIPGLAGASSVPLFTVLGTGTYQVYLEASQANYNSYSSPSPLTVVITPAPILYRNVETNRNVTFTNNKVDFLLVLDISNSMLDDNRRLAARLQGFLDQLTSSSVIDWQMCFTVTSTQNVLVNGVPTPFWGASSAWIGYSDYVLKPSATLSGAALAKVFTDTINAYGAGWANSDDERPIKAAWHHFDNQASNHCYRGPDSAVSVIAISDEDERSVGGDFSQVGQLNEFQYLEDKDLPQNLINKMRLEFGVDKRMTFNSIIVKPGDTTCKAVQDSSGSLSHYGFKLAEMSSLAGGATTSICASDYSQNLNYFKDRIVDSLSSITLECPPIADPIITITPPVSGSFVPRVENGNLLTFSPPIKAERSINVKYKCAP